MNETPLNKDRLKRRCFVSYSGVDLPLKLINGLDSDSLDNRITYFTGYYDDAERLLMVEKVVYGEIEFSHHYFYSENNVLRKAVVVEEDDVARTLLFDGDGNATEA